MEDSKKRAYIKQQATAKKKLKGSLPPKTSSAHLSTKRKPSKKLDCQAKKPKAVTGPVAGETSTFKLPPSSVQGRAKA